MIGGGDLFWNFWLTGPRWTEIADFEPIFARSSLSITPSEKSSINTNRKSTTRFPMSLTWSSYVAPKPQGGSKTQKGLFSVSSHFAWRKSATKFLCVKTVSDKVVRHHCPNYPCKIDWMGTSPSPWNFVSNWPRWSEIADFRSTFARIAPQP